jgi:hypothetical protein
MSVQSQRQLAALFGLEPADQPNAEPEVGDGPPDFDGGARESVPAPSDPEADHNELISALFRQLPSGGGGLW